MSLFSAFCRCHPTSTDEGRFSDTEEPLQVAVSEKDPKTSLEVTNSKVEIKDAPDLNVMKEDGKEASISPSVSTAADSNSSDKSSEKGSDKNSVGSGELGATSGNSTTATTAPTSASSSTVAETTTATASAATSATEKKEEKPEVKQVEQKPAAKTDAEKKSDASEKKASPKATSKDGEKPPLADTPLKITDGKTGEKKTSASKAKAKSKTKPKKPEEPPVLGSKIPGAEEPKKQGGPGLKSEAKLRAKKEKELALGKKRFEAFEKGLQNGFKEDSDDDFLDDDFFCPADKKKAALDKEIRMMKKKAREGMTAQQREEFDNPFLSIQVSDGERQMKKQMFQSFYREQYAKLKNASVDLKQYDDVKKKGDQPQFQAKGGHQPMPRPKKVKLPKDFRKDVGKLKQGELHKNYSCESDSGRLLVSVYGDIFDVSDRPDKYGKDGPYWYMTGRDITWGLVSGDDDEKNMDKFYDLFKFGAQEIVDKRLQGLMSWWAFYEKEYGKPCGRNEAYDKEWGLPAPPHVDPNCSIM
eukprot:TRINITY_DN30616_c0_g1_i1.p1 TRINITY_DN30616_c0_g1~~TRINITY_DN30616_c0_g1_i1.p1  ORF type:complete len:527 (+),score=146.70 TRINITY_DN30616_c0_g1_i1:306-1886(+)